MPKTLHGYLAGMAAGACLLLAAAGPAAAQQTGKFEKKTAERLAELGIGSDEVREIRYVVKRKLDDKAGPDIVGAEAYIRLTRCTGYLIVDMTRAAYVRQTYTTGDCEVAGVPAY